MNAYLNTDGGEMFYGVEDDGIVVVGRVCMLEGV